MKDKKQEKLDIGELKKLTETAIAEGKEKARQLAEIESNKERLKRIADERKAQNVIDQIPGRAKREATEGRSHAIVMAIEYHDYTKHGSGVSAPTGDTLVGAVKIVYDYCVEAGLKPTLEAWDDGVGMNGGHNIVIHW